MNSLLSIHNLTITIAKQTLCSNLNITFNPGEIWAILGCNGAGKSSLLHTLSHLKSPSSGHVELLAQPMHNYSIKKRAQILAVLLQHEDEIFPCSVIDRVLMGRHPHIEHWQWENKQDYAIAMNALTQLDLVDLAQRDLKTLSGGE